MRAVAWKMVRAALPLAVAALVTVGCGQGEEVQPGLSFSGGATSDAGVGIDAGVSDAPAGDAQDPDGTEDTEDGQDAGQTPDVSAPPDAGAVDTTTVPDVPAQVDIISGDIIAPTCGDKSCNGNEDCANCAKDCGACPPKCGDKQCNGNETCANCAKDCGACPPKCGDTNCNGAENCANCAKDCGECPPCGNGEPDPGEECDDGNTEDGDGCSAECKLEV